MEVQGKIKFIGETQTFGSNGFRKREIVITTDEQYPQHIAIDFIKDKCDLLNSYKLNQSVKVGINLGGREWTNPEGVVRYFNSITGWRIETLESKMEKATAVIDKAMPPSNNEDDLPF